MDIEATLRRELHQEFVTQISEMVRAKMHWTVRGLAFFRPRTHTIFYTLASPPPGIGLR